MSAFSLFKAPTKVGEPTSFSAFYIDDEAPIQSPVEMRFMSKLTMNCRKKSFWTYCRTKNATFAKKKKAQTE